MEVTREPFPQAGQANSFLFPLRLVFVLHVASAALPDLSPTSCDQKWTC